MIADAAWAVVGDNGATDGYVKQKLKQLGRNAESLAFGRQAASLPAINWVE